MQCRILVADDTPDMAHLLRAILERAGYFCEIAASGTEALRLYHLAVDTAAPYHIIILDAAMSDKTGFDVAEEVREGNKRTPILMVTAYDDPLVKPHARRIGINYVLFKPFEAQRLLQCVRHLTGCDPKAQWVTSGEIGD